VFVDGRDCYDSRYPVVFQSGSMRTFNIAKAPPGTLILLSDQLVA
jgi:hypothetical protein